MKRVLGVDYGKNNIGVAFADTTSRLAEPLTVLRVKNKGGAIKKLEKIVREKGIEQIVLGISEGKMAEQTMDFAANLQEELKIAVLFQDETLTTKEARRLSQKANIGQKKRKRMEDAYSATLILQKFLDARAGK